jgi:hypothetical protein
MKLLTISVGFVKIAYDSDRREVLDNIPINFRIPMKLLRLIKMCSNKISSRVHRGKHLSDNFPIQNGLKQGDALSSPFFNFALEHAIRKVTENQVELKLHGAHQLLDYADNVNLLGDNTDTVQENIKTLSDASKEVGVEVNTEKAKYVAV